MYTTYMLLKIKSLLCNIKKNQNFSLKKLKQLKYKLILNRKIKNLNIKLTNIIKNNCKLLNLDSKKEKKYNLLSNKKNKFLYKDSNILVLQKRFNAIIIDSNNTKIIK